MQFWLLHRLSVGNDPAGTIPIAGHNAHRIVPESPREVLNDLWGKLKTRLLSWFTALADLYLNYTNYELHRHS